MHHSPSKVKTASALSLILLMLVGCQSLPPPRTIDTTRAAERKVPDWPSGRQFRVDPQASELRIVVESAGRLARFGHPHVLGGPALQGRIVLAQDWRASAFELSIRVKDLELDRSTWRIDEGFAPELPEGAVEATRENLLSPAVLDVEAYPVIVMRSLALIGPKFQPDLDVRVTLRGESRDLTVPISLSMEDDTLIASGRFVLLQSDFGMTPFSALGGALAVSDELLIRFRILARASD